MRTLPVGRGPLIPRQVFLAKDAMLWVHARMWALMKRRPSLSRDDVVELRKIWNRVGFWLDWLEEHAE